MTAPRVCRGASSRSDSQSFPASPAGRPHADTSHPQERSPDTDDWPTRDLACPVAAVVRRATAGLLLMLAVLVTVPAQAQQAAVPGAPTGLMATADAETNIDLAWAAPADTGGAAITGYRIEVSADGGTTWTDRVADTESTDTKYSHTSLTHGDTRHYRVSAINSVGAGAASNVASATAMDSTPPTIVAASTNYNRVLVEASEQLDESPDRAPPASAFTVTADGSSITVERVNVDGIFVGLHGLDPKIATGQTIRVSYRDPTDGDDEAAIQDVAGNDAASFTDYPVRNLSQLRGPPTNLTATAISATQIDLAWEAPAAFTPTAYRIEVSADGGTTWTDRVADTESTDTDYSHTGLTDGDTRHYRVSAIDQGTVGLPSNVASATTMDSTPPTIVAASTNYNRVLVEASEQLDESPDRAPPASAFTVTADGSSITVERVNVDGIFVGLHGLDPKIATGQTIRVSYRDPTDGDDEAAIQDVAGNDAASFTDYPVRNLSQLRGPPTNLTATAISATQIDLAWEAPAAFTPTGYRIEVSADGGTTWTDRVADTESTDTDYSHTGLTDGDTRHYRVSAIDQGTVGLPSNVASATTMDSTPPTIVAASTNYNRVLVEASEQLDESPDRAPPASAFTVTADGSSITVERVNVDGIFVGLHGLDPKIATGQTIRVSYRDPTDGDDEAAIQDVAGNDAASFTDYPVRNLSQLRGPPTNLTATAISATQIDLAWEAPAAFTPTGYRIEVSADGGTTWSDRVADTESTDTDYSHTGLTDGDTRHYRVSAIDQGTVGLPSNVASATTMATDTTPPAVLDSPSLHTVTSSGVELRIAFTEALDDTPGQTPPASAFTVTADGSQVSVSAVSVAGNRVTLDLRATILRDQTVAVSYTDPTPSDDPAAIQDAAGNDAASFTDQAITQ